MYPFDGIVSKILGAGIKELNKSMAEMMSPSPCAFHQVVISMVVPVRNTVFLSLANSSRKPVFSSENNLNRGEEPEA